MKYKLGELGRVITGKTPPTKNNDCFSELPDKYMFITPRDMNISTKEIVKTERYLTDRIPTSFSNLVLDNKSICVSCIGKIGKVFMPSYSAITNQQINSITDIKPFVVPDYLYYYLLIHGKQIQNLASGTTMPIVNKSSFEELIIDMPDLETQKKIVRILSALDEKIEINNQQNITLEKIAFALYNNFIRHLNEANSKQFNLGDIAKCKLGGTPSRAKSVYWDGDINWINSGVVNSFRIIEPSEYITDDGLMHSSTCLLPKGTTVLAITGATLGQISRLEIDSCVNQSIVGILENERISNEYIYLTLVKNIQSIINRQTGGAQQHINKNDVNEFKILVPNQDLMKKFTEQVKPFFDKISINYFENKGLFEIRDLFIPKLISGEIDLEKVENE